MFLFFLNFEFVKQKIQKNLKFYDFTLTLMIYYANFMAKNIIRNLIEIINWC